ncbi:MAG TPA: HepT-like ribonuclease domain-containing protein [Afifellaceae bacterium]|nr:HepT-like ribonuclease domain-containing protein [Afifellaceae bacterium]
MKRPHLSRLRDILHELDLVAEMIEGLDLSAYRRDEQLRRAVERCRSQPPHSVDADRRASRSAIPEIAAIGNLLRHEYQRVDDLLMWKIASQSLPALRPAIVAMLKRAEA